MRYNFIVFAFRFMPLILVVSALAALLTYWGVLPAVVRAFAWVFERTMGIGGAVAVSSAANIFLGMVESPVLVRPYISRLTRGELLMVMCTGLAGVAGTVFVLYATMLAGIIPNAARATNAVATPKRRTERFKFDIALGSTRFSISAQFPA